MKRAIAAVLMLFGLSSCKPSVRDAKRDLQLFLDKTNAGVWRVERVEKVNGRDAVYHGTPAYVMETRVTVKVLRSLKPDSLRDALSTLSIVFRGDTWIVSLAGKEGDERVAVLQLLFVKTDNGWQFKGPCSDCE